MKGVKRRSRKYGPIAPNRAAAYEGLRQAGYSKAKAAAIANAGSTHAGRSRMARKAARNRGKS